MLLGQGEGPSAPPAATASPCAAPALPTDGRGAPLLVLSTVGQGYEEEKKPVAVVGAEKGIKVDEPLAQGQVNGGLRTIRMASTVLAACCRRWRNASP